VQGLLVIFAGLVGAILTGVVSWCIQWYTRRNAYIEKLLERQEQRHIVFLKNSNELLDLLYNYDCCIYYLPRAWLDVDTIREGFSKCMNTLDSTMIELELCSSGMSVRLAENIYENLKLLHGRLNNLYYQKNTLHQQITGYQWGCIDSVARHVITTRSRYVDAVREELGLYSPAVQEINLIMDQIFGELLKRRWARVGTRIPSPLN
jgi:hypothetical protein